MFLCFLSPLCFTLIQEEMINISVCEKNGSEKLTDKDFFNR